MHGDCIDVCAIANGCAFPKCKASPREAEVIIGNNRGIVLVAVARACPVLFWYPTAEAESNALTHIDAVLSLGALKKEVLSPAVCHSSEKMRTTCWWHCDTATELWINHDIVREPTKHKTMRDD